MRMSEWATFILAFILFGIGGLSFSKAERLYMKRVGRTRWAYPWDMFYYDKREKKLLLLAAIFIIISIIIFGLIRK